MFGIGNKKDFFTLDKLFSGYLLTKKEVQQHREQVGFKIIHGVAKGSWKDISNMEMSDHESMQLGRVIGTKLILFSDKDFNCFTGKLNGLISIEFKLNKDVPNQTELPFYKNSYKGWILPNENILSEVKKQTGYYVFYILDPEQIRSI